MVGILLGTAAGLGATAFYYGIQIATNLLLGGLTGFFPPNPAGEGGATVSLHPDYLLIPLVTMAGALVAGVIIYTFAPEAEGHGTDEAVAAFHRKDGRVRRRIPLVKAAASIFTLGSGGSGGREGPTALIGAGIGSMVSDLFHLSVKDRRIVIAAGLGAGIGTIFKAPFAGAILSGEILYSGGDFESEALVPAFIASPVGYIIFGSIAGFTPIFGYFPSNVFTNIATLPVYILLGLACGLSGRVYSTVLYAVKGAFVRLSVPRIAKPMLGAAVTGLIAIFFPQVLGLGYGFLQFLIDGNLSAIAPNYLGLPILVTILVIVFAKIIATSFTIGSGGSAGVFAPSMVIGGFLGAAFWEILNGVVPGWIPAPAPLVIIGMMALFGGVGRAPIAVMLMVSEMTGSLSLLVPAVAAVIVSYFVVGPKNTIYKSQVLRRSESPAHFGEYSTPLLTKMTVDQAMRRDTYYLPPSVGVDDALRRLNDGDRSAVPIVDSSGRLAGIATLSDLRRVPQEDRVTTSLGSIMTASVVTADPAESALSAMNKLVSNDVAQLPVVEAGTGRLVGMVAIKDIVTAYDRIVS